MTSEQLFSEARAALRRGEYSRAEALAARIDRREWLWVRGRLVAGEAAMRDGRTGAAINCYNSVPRDGSQSAVLAVFSLAELYRDMGRLTDAEREYTFVLEHQTTNLAAHERMAFLLGVTGRRWDSLPHFMALLRSGRSDLDQLVLLGDLERPMEQGEYLQRCAKNSPEDVLVQLGLAAHAMAEGRSSEARRLLREVIDRAPNLVAAQNMLGELLVDAGDAELVAWHVGLPSTANAQADTWFVRGLWARRRDQLRVAARCFWEALQRAPTHRRATYQLGQVLVALGESSGQAFVERAGQLYEMTQVLDSVARSRGRDEMAMHRLTVLMEETGRVWEACAWAALATQMFPSSDWPSSTLARLSPSLNEDTPRTLAVANLALQHDLSSFPSYQELVRQAKLAQTRIPATSLRSMIRFEDAPEAGVDFEYVNGADPSTKGARMFESCGGGVAVIDFDADGWPDLFFAQGAEWKSGSTEPTLSEATADRLYRNAGGQSFVDVTRAALPIDRGFGQGCTVGDFDDDGFPDLYVANIGRNQLHRNNGDGTFTDVTADSCLEGQDWTSSCVIVDVNADGLPDIFDVNYLTGPDIFDLICNGRACSPKVFKGVPDRLHLNRGDGTFEFVPNATPPSDSKGLGVVAVEVNNRRRPCLFIANDQVPNFFLTNTGSNDRFNVKLTNEGFIRGVAFNTDGLAMASMGIAADDANGDGLTDFLVTTFKDEPNMLLLQDAQGLFVDAANAAGLRAASLPFVGWGTQFLDADCDGEVDVVMVNGHVDDYRSEGTEYHMRPQFFRNTGAGRFVELLAADAGSYFGKKYLGRGLARLDWDRDGRMDFVVSNIGERASLVSNRSTGIGHFVGVRLHAKFTARDAIGSVVEVTTERRRWSKQLLAGDGYMASNERGLHFGLGDASSVTSIRVLWPSGGTTTIDSPPVDMTLELVEGSSRCTLWRGGDLDGRVVPATVTVE